MMVQLDPGSQDLTGCMKRGHMKICTIMPANIKQTSATFSHTVVN